MHDNISEGKGKWLWFECDLRYEYKEGKNRRPWLVAGQNVHAYVTAQPRTVISGCSLLQYKVFLHSSAAERKSKWLWRQAPWNIIA